jgi:hypothetical protein
MRQYLRSVLAVPFGLLLLAIPVLAHHSATAEFDSSKTFSVKGTLTKLEWFNPHVYIYADVTDENGKVIPYSFETGPPGNLRRAGVVKTMFNVGDVVTIEAAVAKDGSKHLGLLKAVHFADGHTIVFGSPAESEGKNY